MELLILLCAVDSAGAVRASFPHARLRVTPAMHEKLAEFVCAGTAEDPLGVTVENFRGVKVILDADVPDPGWVVETWRDTEVPIVIAPT
jgi:hypothetical protein